MKNRLCFVLALAFVAACGGDSKTTTAPTPTPTPAPTPAPTPTLYTLTGQVTESTPTTSTPIAGASIAVIDSVNAGKSATADAAGRYTITGLQFVGFSINVTANGYQPLSRGASLSSGSSTTTLNLQLSPNPVTKSETFNGTVSGGDSTCDDGIFTKPCRVITIPIHNAGPLTARLTWVGTADLDLSLFRGTTLIASSRGVRGTEEVSANLSVAANYELHVTYYEGSTIANFTLVTTHMN